jgi:response regulator RpfG family c-di-GMP phosphodiesterase
VDNVNTAGGYTQQYTKIMMNILLIDHNQGNNGELEKIIVKLGHTAVTTLDLPQAMTHLADSQRIDLIIGHQSTLSRDDPREFIQKIKQIRRNGIYIYFILRCPDS